MPVNADIQNGDRLVTSASTASIRPACRWRRWPTSSATPLQLFARITCKPLAGVASHTQVLVAWLAAGGTGCAGTEPEQTPKRRKGRKGCMALRPPPPHEILLPVKPCVHRPHARRRRCSPISCPGPAPRLWIKPDFVALVLLYWCIHQPRRVGFAAAWLLGLAMDVADAQPVRPARARLHLLAYAGIALHRRVLHVRHHAPGAARRSRCCSQVTRLSIVDPGSFAATRRRRACRRSPSYFASAASIRRRALWHRCR